MHLTCSATFRVAVVLFAVVGIVRLRAASVEQEAVNHALDGVWVYVGEPGDVRAAPRAGGRYKFRMNNRWTYTQADPESGVVKAHFGGTFRLRGDEYIETIDYSNDADDPELRRSLKFKVKIEGDTMTQTGVGNPYTEVWKRVR
jgi:hypothetical protein